MGLKTSSDKTLILIILTITAVIGSIWLEYKSQSIPILNNASAHFFGLPILQNKTLGDYKIVFQPYPTNPLAGDNSSNINFSVLDKDGNTVVAIFASMNIK